MAKTFIVRHGVIQIKVKLMPTVADVHRAHQYGCKRDMSGGTVSAFFLPSQRVSRYVGTVVFPMEGKLREYVPHEVSHAVIHAQNGVLSHDDEACCTAIGRICSSIFKHLEKMGVAI